MAVPPITGLPIAPNRDRPTEFSDEADAFLSALPNFGDETNILADYLEARALDAENAQTAAETAQGLAELAQGWAEDANLAAQSSANMVGYWVDQTGPLTTPAMVYHAGTYWTLLADILDVTTAEPGQPSGDGVWLVSIGRVTSLPPGTALPQQFFRVSLDGESVEGVDILGAASTIIDDDLTASRVLISGVSGKVIVSPVTAEELLSLDGCTASAAELNKLDGCTSTTAQLNYLNQVSNPVTHFPAGTSMLFQQTSAPTGWTKSVTHNNKALRVVSGTAGSGGDHTFSAVFTATQATSGVTATGTTGLTTVVGTAGPVSLSIAQMPEHTHTFSAQQGIGGYTDNGGAPDERCTQQTSTTSPAGSGATHDHPISMTAHNHTLSIGSHNHTTDLAVQYVDLIIAIKD